MLVFIRVKTSEVIKLHHWVEKQLTLKAEWGCLFVECEYYNYFQDSLLQFFLGTLLIFLNFDQVDIKLNDFSLKKLFFIAIPQVRTGDIETEKRLRKDLKRTKALLADAQIMLDHIKNNAPSKREIAQLKNQV